MTTPLNFYLDPIPTYNTMHVGNIEFTTESKKNGREVLMISVIVLDSSDGLVEGATVYGTLTTPIGSKEYSGITKSGGTITFEYFKRGKPGPLDPGDYEFLVTNIDKTGWTFEPSSNDYAMWKKE